MAIIIVEGVDGSGKTTLINKLQKDLNVITIKSPRPRDYQDCKDLLARTLLLGENTNILCDRIGIISEPIYGPICRNTLGFPLKAETEKILQMMNPIIIHCNPRLEFCEQNIKNNPQMEGVRDHLYQLHHAYQEWMSQIYDESVFVIPYDYTEDSYEDLLSEVKEMMDVQNPHPLDRETAAVHDFHKKFGVNLSQLVKPGVMDRETFEFRKKFMQEELDEFCEAYEEGNVVKMFDALLDLTYVVKGTALFGGISSAQWALGFDCVHRKNMQKMRVPNGAASKRGSALDVVKPEGWTPPEPELKKILGL
jgi:predicted HAD superfamily Cof-like phosphohydrolase